MSAFPHDVTLFLVDMCRRERRLLTLDVAHGQKKPT
jgi:hypothetical protein